MNAECDVKEVLGVSGVNEQWCLAVALVQFSLS